MTVIIQTPNEPWFPLTSGPEESDPGSPNFGLTVELRMPASTLPTTWPNPWSLLPELSRVA